MFGAIKVYAGDFSKGDTAQLVGVPVLGQACSLVVNKNRTFGTGGEEISITEIDGLEIATEESTRKFLGTFLGGAVGGIFLGPLGLLAGLLVGGTGKRVTFILRLKDGRKLLGSTDSKTYTKLSAAIFDLDSESSDKNRKEKNGQAGGGYKNPFLE